MKCIIPEISWHNRDPVLSVDFQPKTSNKDQIRLATAGTDTHVLIWYVSPSATGGVILEVAADLARHQKAVNVVRWSPSGVYLASGDDESIIFIWNQRTDKDPPPIFEETNEQDRETWVVYKTLRGHVEDVYDISWNSSSTNLVSGSVDNKIIFWDLHKGRSTSIVSDHKGFVQGVSWDPKDQYIATLSSDRVFRVFDVKTKKVVSRSSKAVLPVPSSHPLHNQTMRLYYDDTLQSFFRRLQFSPDGLLIAAPSGYIEPDQNRQLKAIHGVYIYTRYSLKVPACILPCGDSPALAVRWSPLIYDLRKDGPKPAFGLESRRMILAVATKAAVLLYDTQQKSPLAVISNIHYTRLTDLTWSSDGKIVVVSSTDGFCSVIYFSDKELGEVHVEPIIEQMEVENVSSEVNQLIPKQFKIPIEKNNKSDTIVIEDDIESPAVEKRQISVDMMDEIAMEPWSDDSQNACKPTAPTLVEEASTDIKLVYEESQSSHVVEKKPSPKLVNEVISQAASPTVNSSPKPGRRLTFVTLSSPKNKKKVK